MKKIEAIIDPGKFREVKRSLREAGIRKMTVTEVREFDRDENHTELYRGREYVMDFRPHLKIEVTVTDQELAPALEAIAVSSGNGKNGGGEILVFAIEQVVGFSAAKLNGHTDRFSIPTLLN